jgi:hypothetical protein
MYFNVMCICWYINMCVCGGVRGCERLQAQCTEIGLICYTKLANSWII